MKTITILEAGNLGGVVVMIIGIIILGALFFSLVVTVVAKIIYEWKGDRKFTKKQFIQTMLICLLICGLISGYMCGGGF
ncbi:hypothetical protein [Chryseobacterium indologenes]|uniref:hypothetical protein n=1 Tax=Chryseobacterium indologenes TaxID=253 RepID=UPI000BFE1075|nr:hypothetical protein [Chryseobacterium indologenes]ATN07193.1 hypothetical protein CRN76_18160 [Chryseobacterium indologenes]AYY84058.1 hypothetical protein EGX91_05620 [Chryseobacterium indologenes]QIX81008.1 hypothetical protein FOB56_07070 [Chryseobacterium indologenes]TLX27498.1 hypothetical protein FE904_00450 [Chryseobacterium indologenes]UDQ54696.1 hypothetical protein LJF28_03250 [Chryseobacterium indologenes]